MPTEDRQIVDLVRRFLSIPPETAVGSRENLQAHGLDSLNCIELILLLEEEFHLTIPEEKLGIQHMHTLYDICQLTKEALQNDHSLV